MFIQSFTFGPLQENTYLLYDESGEAIVIDPGCCVRQEEKKLADFIKEKSLSLQAIVNTHAHLDHVAGVHFVHSTYKVPFYLHAKEDPILRAGKAFAPMYGFENFTEVLPDNWLVEGENYTFGNTTLALRFVPGHSPGHLALIEHKGKSIIAGDVLFRNSIGRADLPGGDFNTLINSIKTQLFTLPDDYIVYPGHGPTTTIGYEKLHNPYLA